MHLVMIDAMTNEYQNTRVFSVKNILIILLMLCGMNNAAWGDTWDGTIKNNANNKIADNDIVLQTPGQANSESNPYIIDNAKKFAYFMRVVQSGWTGRASTFYWKLTTDIDLNGIAWTYGTNNGGSFQGHFDGGGHTISNLSIAVSGNSNHGLFPTIQGANATNVAEVKNLIIDGVTFTSDASRAATTRVGALAGLVKQANITNVDVKNVTINYNNTITADNRIGGAIGGVENNTILDDVDVTGVTATFKNTTTGLYFGGVVGYASGTANTSSMVNCDAKTIQVTHQSNITGTTHMGGLVGQANTSLNVINNNTVSGVVTAGVEGPGFTVSVAGTVSTFDVGGLLGYTKGGAHEIKNNKASNISITVNGATAGGSIYLSGLIGYAVGTGSPSTRKTIQGNTVSNSTVTMNGAIGHTTYIGGFLGYADTHTNVLNNKVTSPAISITNNINAAAYVGGAVGAQNGYTLIDGMYVNGGSITGPSTDKNVLNGKTFFVGGFIGYQLSTNVVDYQPNKFRNVVVSDMTINLAHYIPSSTIKDHKFAVGGIAGAVNAPNQDSKGNRGMPENLVSKGVKIYAPFAPTSPTVALFSNGAVTFDTYSHEKITTIDAIERSKVASWLYTDYKLGLSKSILAKTNAMETAPANGKVRRNYDNTATVTNDVTDYNLQWLTVDDNTFQKANRNYDHVRDSKTVLWWTRSDNNASYANTDVEQTLYPQYNSTTANSATNQYNYYWYFYQGVANARYVTPANATKIIAGIDANITEAAKETPLTLSVTNNKENERGFDARTITVTPSAAVSSYEWYVNGEKQTETGTSISLKPDWMWGKGIVVNALDGSSNVIASQSYVLPIGVFKTKNGDALRSNIKERGTSTNPYILDSEEDLRQLSYLSTYPRQIYFEGLDKLSSDGKYAYHSMLHYNRAYYELGADITLHGEFTPISHVGTSADGDNGTYSLNYFFQGVFDGKGHKISGLQVTWDAGHYNANDANIYYGLFGILGHSAATAKWQDGSNSNTVVKNLVIDGATFTHDTNNTSFYYNNGNSGNSNNCMVGVLAGIVSANTTVQNIEIRNSSITDAGSPEYKLATRGLYVGGAIGSVQYDNKTVTTVPADTKIEHIAAQVNITLTHPAFVNPKPSKGEEVSKINAGGIIGRFIASSSTQDDAQKVMPKYTFYSGRINAPKAWISPVLAYTRFSANTDYAYFSKIWEGNNNAPGTQLTIEGAQYYNYYIGDDANLITTSYPANNCLWDARSLVFHQDASENANTYDPMKYQGVNFGASFVDSSSESLQSLNENTTDGFNWKWSDAGFPTLTKDPYIGAFLTRSGDTFTANLTGAVATSYKWAASFDGVTWHDLTATGNTYTATVSLKPKYVVAYVNTNYRTRPEVVEPADNVCDPKIEYVKVDDNSKYTVNMHYTIPTTELHHTYQWLKSDNQTVWEGQTNDNITLTPAQVTEGGDLVWCTINVTELDEIIATYNISYGNSVIFVDGTKGNDANDGKTPATAVKTIDVANGKLKTVAQGGTWDNNFIVVIDTLNYNSSFTSRGLCPATITGKWDEIPADNVAVIDLKKNDPESVNPGDGIGKTAHNNYVSADTKFENLVFWTSTQQDNALFECHGHDVWFGKGIRMKNFRELSDNHGNLVEDKQPNIPELSIILTASNPDEAAITRYTKDRTKPQTLTIESGHYGRILGGRFVSNFFAKTENTAHAILGTANDPVWAVINVDIDKNNDEYSADATPKKYSCDINCIIAGLTDGTVYGDYEINLKGGNVRYIVGGNQGNGVLSGDKTYTPEGGSSGKFGQWPNSSFFGRSVINVEQNPDSKPIILNNLYAGGLGRKADKDVAVVDMYMYGRTEVNLKSGTILGNVYGGGAGGVIGLNPWDAHVPYDATGISDDTNTAIYKGVQYGDTRVTGAWSSKTFGTDALVDVALHNPDGRGGYTKELFNLANSSTTVNVTGGTIGTLDNGGNLVAGTGNVYGGGNGYVSNLPVNLAMQGIGSVFGTTNVNISGDPVIRGNVYGGSMGDKRFYKQQKNVYQQTITHIAETNGTVNLYITGTEEKCPVIGGNIYGAGKGIASDDEKEEDYARIATTGNSTLGDGNQYKSEINVTIDLPKSEAHKFIGKIYGGGQMGMVDGNTNVNVKHGIYTNNVFGGGYGEDGHADKAKVTGETHVNIVDGTFRADIYGGGEMGMVDGNTNVSVSDGIVEADVYGGGLKGTVSGMANVNLNGAQIRGDVFGGGNLAVVGTAAVGAELDEGDERNAWAMINGTSVVMDGANAIVYGDIFGGGNRANVEGNTSVNLITGHFGGNVYGGGNGVLYTAADEALNAEHKANTPATFADISNNCSVRLQGANVLWNALWDKENKKLVKWNGTWTGENRERFVTGASVKSPVFVTMHNVYGGGNKACRVAGNDSVLVEKGFANADLLNTDIWKNSFYDNANPHFYVFGGGYGPYTTATNTYVSVGVEGTYEDGTTTEQLSKPFLANFLRDGGNDKLNAQTETAAKRYSGDLTITGATGEGSDDASMGVYDNSFGIPLYTVLGVLGGGYSGLITGNTNVTVGGETFIHRVYGGGYGSLQNYQELPESAKAQDILGGTDTRNLRDILGEVGGKSDVTVNGAYIYGDVFGGGAGVESTELSSVLTDFSDMARVRGGNVAYGRSVTKVTVSDKAQIYGSVYGGGDIANVGVYAPVDGTSVPSYSPADGTLTNVRSFVNVIGGDIFGEVFGGGGGRQHWSMNDGGTGFVQTTATDDVLGRIEGNTLVHIANSKATEDEAEDIVPNVWQRIYGGGNLGSVNGNTKVWLEGGNIGLNIIGGGNGYAANDNPDVEPASRKGTYANVYGNTEIVIDGGNVIWDKAADAQGNVTEWTNASKVLIKTEKEMRQLFVSRPDSIRDLLVPYLDKRFFDYGAGNGSIMKFPINHNIYGGGRYACHVGTYDGSGNISDANTGKSTVTLNHSIITDERFLDIRTVAGLCWYSIVNNTSEPQFSAFGGGYGANTKVGKTQVNVQIGKADVYGSGLDYAEKERDDAAWNNYETKLQEDWASVTDEEKTNLYGGTNENAYRRYRTARYALSLGVPNHTYMNVYGGGYSGYVVGNTSVNVSGTSGIRNVYGGGLGAVSGRSIPMTLDSRELVESALLKDGDTNSSTLTYGSVGGNTTVDITEAIVSLNVYGGGAGVESKYLNNNGRLYTTLATPEALALAAEEGTLTDFPLMAHVAGKTKVNITGNVKEENGHSLDRTIVYGKVFGGGDVANVGDITKKDDTGDNAMPSAITWVDGSGNKATEAGDAYAGNAFTSSVTIDGGLVMSHILAGGSGRPATECAEYRNLGGIYGNSRVIIKNNETVAWSPWLWNNIYGGGENGTVYGNSLVQVRGGYIGYNIFGGGWGYVDGNDVSSADIKRNTFVDVSGGEYVLTQMWNEQSRSWAPNNQRNSPQFDYDTKKFLINHNIYGGGNMACSVGGSTWVKMTKGLLKDATKVSYESSKGGYNLFATEEWRDVYNKTGSPHFSVYGGGFGSNTTITRSTNLDIRLTGAQPIATAPAISSNDELYSHFFSEQAVMDITGGGYSGKVLGKANVKIGGDTFARRILGGGFYGSVGETQIDIKSVDCSDIFGGGLMGDVGTKQNTEPTGVELTQGNGVATINLGTNGAPGNNNIWVHKNIYGANDVSGSIYSSANINIYGGHMMGNVYGAGNGNYLYAQGDKNTTQVTVNEYYKTAETTYDLVYTVPTRNFMSSVNNAPEAAKMVNVNSFRPATQNVNINLSGAVTSAIEICGNVFGGGNSATVNEIYNAVKPTVRLNIGNYLTIKGGVYLGCDGDAMFDDKTNYMNAYQDVNKVDLTHSIDWIRNPGNKAVSYQYLPVDENDRPKIYKTNLDLYFQPVEMAVQPTVMWNGSALGNVSNTTIGTFVCGGNRGNMNVKPNNEGKIVDITFPAGLTINDKIVGGCNNANITYKETFHEGGYLLGRRNPTAANADGNNDIALKVECQFQPKEVSGVMEGGNVYGGCYKSGTINGDIFLDIRTNMLSNVTEDELNTNRTKDGIALGNVYGAGYGNDSYVYGNTTVLFGKGVNKNQSFPTKDRAAGAKADGASAMMAPTPIVANGAAANYIYGGGQQGNLIGNSLVRIYNGRITSSVCGGSYAGYMWGSTQVLVGYPKYYTCQKSGIYNLKRADTWNTATKNHDKSYVIKQKIYLLKGDVVSEEVYQAIEANTVDPVLTPSELSAAFTETSQATGLSNSGLAWDDIDIKIDEAVYGGGYSLASGSSVAAGTYTVKKYDEDKNLNTEIAATDPTELAALNAINSSNGSKGFGGNTTVLIWDQPTDVSTTEHIAISSQEMMDVTSSVGVSDDLFGYYYKLSASNNYKYVFETGYTKSKLSTEASGSVSGTIYGTDGKVYTYNGEGGMYGDGHLSFAEGFRSGELYGYGFAQHTPDNAKIMNTFQRMDMLRVTDCAVRMLGSRDYTVNQISTTPYSIIRIGELQMRAENVKALGGSKVTATAGDLAANNVIKSRNFIGLANNIHYIGAIESNVSFDAVHRSTNGTIDAHANTYRKIKKDIIDAYYNGKIKKNDASEAEFQKRNDATAANMMGISSGFAMRVQNVYTKESETDEKFFYGPIIGVVEVNLTDTHKDEAGAYVYADNIHDDVNHFLESTGNFVFPYNAGENRYVVDDCYPKSFTADNPTNIDAHYWYVTGWDYYYNAHITGYTYDHTTSNGEGLFYSENNDKLMNLMGTYAGADVKIKSITWHSNHAAGYECDLEHRNTLPESTSDNVDAGGHDVSGKYTLSVGTFDNDSPLATDNHGLSFTTGDGNPETDKYITRADDEDIHIRLMDLADNSGNDYYTAHMSKPCLATIVLTSDAKELDKTSTKYKYTPVENVVVGTTVVTGYYTFNQMTGTYTQIVDGDHKAEASTTYYTREAGKYTYTINLTIDYVLGPSYKGNLKIHNCALPGEMIKVDKGNIQLTGDQSFMQTGTTYTFGKIRQNPEDPAEYQFVPGTETYSYTIGEKPEPGSMLDGVRYDKDGDYILVPAYYFMNGYGVQYRFNVSGITQQFPVDILPSNTLLVHNYHRMLPRSSSGERQELDQHLDLAAERAAAGEIAEPRIYLVDNLDLNEFGAFLDEKSSPTAEVGSKYDFGAHMQFFLQRDITAIKEGDTDTGGHELTPYVAPHGFKGMLHGDGHVINGLDQLPDHYLIGTSADNNTGNIYNLGITKGVITQGDNNSTNTLYHCSYTYNPSCADDNTTHVVYRMDGTAVTDYTEDDWRYGKVAYDLNQYYLDKRYVLGASGASHAASYVENYYANGDYLYANYSAANHYNGSEFLRTAARPNYGEPASLHDATHTIDVSRAVDYEAPIDENPASYDGYQPLFDAKSITPDAVLADGTEKNDYIFWGQLFRSPAPAALATVNATMPASISTGLDLTYAKAVNLVSDMANRVYRAAGYYGSTVNNGYYYNHAGYVYNNGITAIDFYGYNDPATGTPAVKTYTEGGAIGGHVGSGNGSGVEFYQPVADYGLQTIGINKDVTRNLLMYANSPSDLTAALAAYVYDDNTPEEDIRAHAISQSDAEPLAPKAEWLHLVERPLSNLNAPVSQQYCNDFCVPVQFTVGNRAWYTRQPVRYAEAGNDAWEGICLPFTANKVEASLNGEMTHFYGTPTEGELADPDNNIHTLHHEYWLRGLTTVGEPDVSGNSTATFQRPGTVGGLFINAAQTAAAMDYDYNYNSFFVDSYGTKNYNSTDNPWYTQSHVFTGYLPLTSSVPYIVSFPGNRYYEFDLSSLFYNTIKEAEEPSQTVTFNAYGIESGNDKEVVIPVDTLMQTPDNADPKQVRYLHTGTFMTLNTADYGINASGTSFSNTDKVVMPFRTYMATASGMAHAKSIFIGSLSTAHPKEEMLSEYGDDPEKNISESGMAIYSKGNRIIVRSTYDTVLRVHSLSGRLLRILDVRNGINTYSGFQQGIYIVGTTKLYVK